MRDKGEICRERDALRLTKGSVSRQRDVDTVRDKTKRDLYRES